MVLLDHVDVDSVSSGVVGENDDVTIIVTATSFGGGSILFDIKENGSSTVQVPVYEPGTTTPLEIDYPHVFKINLPVGLQLRARLVGSSGASNVYVAVLQ